MTFERHYDVVVIGAGPAGMAAAAGTSELGLNVALIDEQSRPGGQIYRNIGIADASLATLLGKEYAAGRAVLRRLEQSTAEVRSGALVWDITSDRKVTLVANSRSEVVSADHLVIAAGALERPSPIAGWTLPGVMSAGAAQIALKSGPSVPAGRIVLAGAGPLLLLVACQLLDAGAQVAAIVETAPVANRLRALRALPAAMRSPKPLLKGLGMIARLRRSNVPWFAGVDNLVIEGQDRAQSIRFDHRGRSVTLPADMILLHHGVVPNVQLSRLLRLEHIWNDAQLAWHPTRNAWGESATEGVWLAGDGSGIAGAVAAEASGMLAALGIAHASGRLTASERDARARVWRKRLSREQAVRPFLDALYRPPHWIGCPSDETIVCRCEEVTAGRVREMARLGCAGPNQTKFFSRCGMGPCQGRLCGITVTQLIAEVTDKTPQQVGAYRVRAPIKPIPLRSISVLGEIGEVVSTARLD